MTVRAYGYISKLCVLGAVAAAFLYGGSPTKTAIAIAVAGGSAAFASGAYFWQTWQTRADSGSREDESVSDVGQPSSSPEERNAAREHLPQLSIHEIAAYQANLSEAYIHWHDSAQSLFVLDDLDADRLDYLARGLRHRRVSSDRDIFVSRPYPVSAITMDNIADLATKLYASQAGQDLECALMPDGTFIISSNSKRVPRQSQHRTEQETSFEFAESGWPHLESRPI